MHCTVARRIRGSPEALKHIHLSSGGCRVLYRSFLLHTAYVQCCGCLVRA